MEEETAAMATQFASSDVVMDETFSKLPEHIIHCILGCLPCIKDVVRTSAISKSWLQAWRTFPIPEFNVMDFVPHSSSLSREEDEAKSEHFIRFVDSSLQRFGRQDGDGNGNRMKMFNLTTVNNMAHHISRWTCMALDNKVEHLTLEIFKDCSRIPCIIPHRVLSAYWLKSLILYGSKIYIPLSEVSHVNLPSLTSLRILDCNISEEQLQKLLSGCPVLEQIALFHCKLLSKVEVFDHPNLETLEVTGGSDLTAIRVRAPKLKSFGYTYQSLDKGDVVVKIHNGHGLKSLRISDCNKTDEWFHKFILQFPLIENLTIERCNALRKIRISNPLLEKINIKHCCDMEDVVICCKKLASFILFTRASSIPKPFIRMEMNNPPNDCTVKILAPRVLMEASWYCKLKEFLSGPFTFKSVYVFVLTLSTVVADGDMKEKDVHKKLPLAASKIENLRLDVNSNSSCHPYILNGLLCACHPTTIELPFIQGNAFVKFVCEELGNRENNINCWCKDDFKCWKHQLKEVKIEKIIGIKLEKNLDWDAFSDLLPTLKDENDIYFKLMW